VATDAKYHVILNGSKVIDENPSTGQKYPNNPDAILPFFVV